VPTLSFRECQRVLQLYTEALAGERVELRSTDDLPQETTSLRQDVPTSTAHAIFLPETVDQPGPPERGFAVFKVGIVHQLGFKRCGTFDFDLAELRRRDDREPPSAESTSRGSDLARFFDSFDDSDLARRLFSVFEDTRIDAWVARNYRGMQASLTELTAAALASRPDARVLAPAAAMLEALVQLSLGGQLDDEVPVAPERLAALRSAIESVSSEHADVYDSAAAVVTATALFRDLPAPPRRSLGEAGLARPDSDEADLPAGLQSDAGEAPSSESPAAKPVPFRGDLRPDLVQKELQLEALLAERDAANDAGSPVPPDLLEKLLEEGKVEITGAQRNELDRSSGLTLRDLAGLAGLSAREREKASAEEREQTIRELQKELGDELGDMTPREGVHFYPEWDFELPGYRPGWCRLLETLLPEEDASELEKSRAEQARLFNEVRQQFELLRPDSFRKIRRLSDGEEVDLDAAIEAITDLRAGASPAEEVYMRRNRRERDVAAAFLLDMSASTDSEIKIEAPPEPPPPDYDFVGVFDEDPFWTRGGDYRPPERRRVIDVEKEALLLMAEALEALGDAYGIYGFSGYGRHNVDFFVAKDFDQGFDAKALARISAIRPKRSTRMGPPIRHVVKRLAAQDARVRVLLILSDGYPQDFDYGRDRTSRDYGMQDTMMALREAELRGIHTFCITVDPAGHDYLRDMCPESQYLVIDDIAALPRELPKVYRGLTT
jgi:hypothetical protein